MAEQVQAILDRMVPALRDLMDKEVFTQVSHLFCFHCFRYFHRCNILIHILLQINHGPTTNFLHSCQNEVKAIVSRRREFEYLLRRRSSRKSDYWRYIEEEKNLEKLRSLRNKKILARKAAKEREDAMKTKASTEKHKQNKPKSNSSIGDASIVQHIHLLYTRAKRKWKQDMAFHVQHAEFAKEKKSYNMLSKIYAEALQIHPRNTSLWIEAASHEYFGYIANTKDQGMSGGGSIKSARVLLQRGLRVNSDSQDLWLQSFCLELHYIQKLRGRRELLQLGLKRPKIVDNDDSDENDENAPIESFYEDAKLPRIIFRNAIKSIPKDVAFRIQFIDQCRLFPQTQIIIDEIMGSIEGDFGEVEEAWIARAKFAMGSDNGSNRKGFLAPSSSPSPLEEEDGNDSLGKRKHNDEIENAANVRDDPLQILAEATDCVKTPKMFMETISFARSYIDHLCSNSEGNELSAATKRDIMNAGILLKNVVKKAIDTAEYSADLVVECTTVLTELGSPKEALDFIEGIVKHNKDCNGSAKCWMKYAEIKTRLTGDLSVPCKLYRRALKQIPLHDENHKPLLLKLFSDLLVLSSMEESSSYERELESLYDKILLINHQKNESEDMLSLPSIALAYIKHLISRGNMNLVRKVYSKLLFTSNYTKLEDKTDGEISDMKAFIDQCIVLEKIEFK
jgi:U3 small nucleolar RNA-associated protein 6